MRIVGSSFSTESHSRACACTTESQKQVPKYMVQLSGGAGKERWCSNLIFALLVFKCMSPSRLCTQYMYTVYSYVHSVWCVHGFMCTWLYTVCIAMYTVYVHGDISMGTYPQWVRPVFRQVRRRLPFLCSLKGGVPGVLTGLHFAAHSRC